MNKRSLLVIFISILALFGVYGVSCAGNLLLNYGPCLENTYQAVCWISGTKLTTAGGGTYARSTATSSWVYLGIGGASITKISYWSTNYWYTRIRGSNDNVIQRFVDYTEFLIGTSTGDYLLLSRNGNDYFLTTGNPYSYIDLTTTISKTYLNNPVTLSGNYVNADTYDQINFNIESITYGQTLNIPNIDIVLANGSFAWSKDFNMPYTGNFIAKVRLYNSSTASTTEWSSSISFGLASTTEVLNGNISTTTVGVLGTEICDILDVACHLKNVLIVLFQPSTNSVNQLVSYKTQIQNKPPFGYITILITNLGNLSTTTATSSRPFNITIPTGLDDLIFNPLRIGLNALLWFVGLVWLYNRLKHIQL